MDSLDKARQTINLVDAEMAKLFETRMAAVKEIAEYKRARGLEIYDKKREDEIILKNSNLINDSEIAEYYVSFLKNNMAVSKKYQDRIINGARVAYSGTVGAFAYIAAEKLFQSAEKIAYPDFESAYKAVENGECDLAVLPIENSFNGEVGQVTDLMFSGSLFVNRVMELPVTQDLLAVEGAVMSDIKTVVSHPQALGQCRNFIKENGLLTKEYQNTALAAEYVKSLGDKSVAAIASAEAAEIFGLTLLQKNINESRTNTTRFAVFSRKAEKRGENEKSLHSIFMFTVKNEAGALAKAIEIIGRHGFNMKILRSRPLKELIWQYYFYIESLGNVNTAEGEAMLNELKDYCIDLKVIGTYK